MKLIIPSDSSHGRAAAPSERYMVPVQNLDTLAHWVSGGTRPIFPRGLPNLSKKCKGMERRCRRNSALFGGGLECIIYSASEGVTAGGEVFVARTDYFSCFGRLDFLLRTVQLH